MKTSVKLKIVILVMLKENVWPVLVAIKLLKILVLWSVISQTANNAQLPRIFVENVLMDLLLIFTAMNVHPLM